MLNNFDLKLSPVGFLGTSQSKSDRARFELKNFANREFLSASTLMYSFSDSIGVPITSRAAKVKDPTISRGKWWCFGAKQQFTHRVLA
ncbi:hypothetical protein ACOSP7_009819 [Xanthoceras sorbifolium]